MTGLTFLAIGLLWLAFSVFVGRKLPQWIGIRNLAGQWAVTVAAVAVLLVGPFVDHIVGMRQFQRLCDEQTGLQILPGAASTKRGKEDSSKAELMAGTAIPIRRRVSSIIDIDTGETIARYNYFTTRGGVIGGSVMLGGEYVCSIYSQQHPDHQKYLTLKEKIKLTYGEAK